MEKEKNALRVIGHLKNGDEFTPGKIATTEITKALIETIGLAAFVGLSSRIREEATI